jgi:hypothetical protein
MRVSGLRVSHDSHVAPSRNGEGVVNSTSKLPPGSKTVSPPDEAGHHSRLSECSHHHHAALITSGVRLGCCSLRQKMSHFENNTASTGICPTRAERHMAEVASQGKRLGKQPGQPGLLSSRQ